MNTLRTLLDAVVAHGPTLLLGATAVLTIGIGLMLLQRCPARRRTTGLCTALACAVYLLAGMLPLPRVSWRVDPPAAVEPAPAPATTERAPAQPLDTDALDAEARAELLMAVLQQETLQAQPTPAGPAAPAPTLAAPAPAAPRSSLPWALLAAAAYAAGALLMLARGLLGVLRLRLLLARSMPAPSGMLQGIDVPARTRVRLVRDAVRPFCAGAWRPVIVLPASLALRTARAEAHAVLRHEAAHVRAGDPRLQALLALLAVPLWCHPLYWWVCRRVRFCSELLADDAASRGDRAGYARALLDLAERGQHQLVAAGTIAVFRRPSEFYRRIQMLLQREGTLSPPATLRRRTAHLLCTAGLAAAFSMLLGVPATAQDPSARDVQAQNKHLHATIQEMRAELLRLRDEIEQLRATTPEPAPAGASPGEPAPEGTPSTDPHSLPTLLHLLQSRQQLDATRQYELLAQGDHAAAQQTAVERLMRAWRPGVAGTIAPEGALHGALGSNGQPGALGADGAEDQPNAPVPAGALFGAVAQAPTPAPLGPQGSRDSSAATNAIAELASRYVDLQAELEVAEPAAAQAKSLAENGLTPQSDARRAFVHVQTLRKKVAMVKGLVEGEIRATETELAWLEKANDGQLSGAEQADLAAQRARAAMRLEALRSVQ